MTDRIGTQTTYSETVTRNDLKNILNEVLPSNGGGAFIAEYNVTTLSAIDTAYNNGNTIICHYSTTVIIDPSDPSTTTTIDYYVPLISRLEQTGYQQYNFCVFGDAYGSTRIGITVDNTNGWTLYT